MDEIQNTMLNNEIKQGLVSTEDQISLNELLRFFSRNRRTLFLFVFLGSILGVLIALNSKRTYEGQFQIVVEDESNAMSSLPLRVSSQLSALNNIVGMSGLGSANKELKTQVAILKSPSVLMSVFEYVKDKKIEINNKKFKDMRFKTWRKKSFDFKLEKGTEVLNLAYRDKNKELILPVLSKISNLYQNYSGEENRLEIKRGIDYFEDQISFYKNKIPNSEEKMIKYGEKYNLSLVKSNTESVKDKFITILNVEDMKNSINILDKKILDLRSIYAENDRSIQNLIRKKKILIESAKRPTGVISTYKQLLNEVNRDKETLVQLENNLRILNLQQARNSVPWRLITKPTLLPKPVAPKRRNIAAICTFIGFLTGSLVSLGLERRSGKLFSAYKIKSQINLPLIAELHFDSKNEWLESLYLIISNIISENNEKIGILITNELDISLTKKIEKKFQEFIKQKQLVFTKEIREISKLNKSILLLPLGLTKKSTITQINNGILFKEDSFLGFLILNNLNI